MCQKIFYLDLRTACQYFFCMQQFKKLLIFLLKRASHVIFSVLCMNIILVDYLYKTQIIHLNFKYIRIFLYVYISNIAREAAVWELEERHLQEKHQLSKRQLKDIFFLQRHQMLVRHEKVKNCLFCSETFVIIYFKY